MKLEGQLGDEEMAGVLKMREAWLLVMPELEGQNMRAAEMLRWIMGNYRQFTVIYANAHAYTQPSMTRLSCTAGRGCTVGILVTQPL